MLSAVRFALLSLACFVAVALTGCSPAQQIVGKWDLDVAKAMAGAPIPEGANNLQMLAAQALFEQVKVQISFEGNGSYAVSAKTPLGPPVEKKGSWRYVKMDGKALVLMVKEAGKTDENELRFTPTDADHAEMSMPSLAIPGSKDAMPFVRVKPAS